ncbi:MAG: hypothetical protein V3V91_05680, partial [Thermoplasmata archaeon]
NWIIETVDSDGFVGMHTSIAIDSNDRPHISYYDASNTDLKYARWNGTWWGGIETVDSLGVVGEFTALALDGKDDPHITYRDWSNNDFKYAFKAEGKWNLEIVDDSGISHYYNSIAIDSRNDPHITYLDTNNMFKYAKRTGGCWSFEIVDTEISTGKSPSLALDSNDNPHISYWSNGSLKYARWNGTAWTYEIVDSGIGPGFYTSLALDDNDDPHISYLDKAFMDLKYATKAELPGPSRTQALDIDPDTLNLKSRGRWITAYLSAENASVYDINISSILLQDTLEPERYDYQDDVLMLKFNRQEFKNTVAVGESVEVKITGKWKDGESFEAYDYIRVIDPGKK